MIVIVIAGSSFFSPHDRDNVYPEAQEVGVFAGLQLLVCVEPVHQSTSLDPVLHTSTAVKSRSLLPG